MVVLGLDPGYGIVGYGIINYNNNFSVPIAHGVILTPKNESLSKRLKYIGDKIREIIIKFEPQEIAIEKIFFQKNTKTAILVAEARGVILYVCEEMGKTVYEYTPNEIKQSVTGYGKAEKKQIQEMVRMLLKLKDIPKPDDAADALAIALTHIQNRTMLSY